jgi:hypothetical protein
VLTVDRMAGMDAGPGTALGGVAWFAVSWLVMMAAMMLPAMVPMVVAYGRRADRASPTALFVAGYLGAWLAAGLAAYATIEGVRSLGPGFLAWLRGPLAIAGAGKRASGLPRSASPRCSEYRCVSDECGSWPKPRPASTWGPSLLHLSGRSTPFRHVAIVHYAP